MGKVVVKLRIRNSYDENQVALGQARDVREVELEALVDTGAWSLVLPQWAVDRLGLIEFKRTTVRLADGRTSSRPVVKDAHLYLQGRDTVQEAIVLDELPHALLGQLPLEAVDLYVDARGGRLVPNPESPDEPLFHI